MHPRILSRLTDPLTIDQRQLISISNKSAHSWMYLIRSPTHPVQDEEENQHGVGSAVFKNEGKYNGDFRRNLMHGNGTYVWSNKTQYRGSFLDNQVTRMRTHSCSNRYTVDVVNHIFQTKYHVRTKLVCRHDVIDVCVVYQ